MFSTLTEAQLRNRLDPQRGIFIAESPKVIRVALQAGYQPAALLCERRHIEGDAKTLILLKKIPELYGIRVTGDPETENPSGSWLRIGAMCSFQEILDCDAAPAWLKTAVRYLASLPRRFKATVGGNIASWRSDSYLVPTLIASGAKLSLMGKEGILLEEIGQYAADREKYSDALITGILVKPDEQVQILAKRYANTVESHACLTIAMGKEGDTYRIGLAIKNCGIFLPDITNWGISWKKAGVQDDMFGSEEYKRYLTETTLDTMYEKLGGEGGTES